MDIDETTRLPRPLHFLWSGLLAIGFLGVLALILPEPGSTPPEPLHEGSGPRQHVIIFVVDSTDGADAHGDQVRSVIRQYCGACEVRPINVHGNMSAPRLQLALEQVRQSARQELPTTSIIVNLSWGTYAYHNAMHNAIRALRDLGTIIVASAGNDNTAKPFYPAAFDEALGVCSSSRYRKTKAAYSNYGSWIGLCAPGLHYVSRPLQHGGVASGTSFAAPMVAGVLGQSLLDAPCATTRQGLQALLRTADPFPQADQTMTAGRLNRDAAGHYLSALYACGSQPSLRARLLRALRHISSKTVLVTGLIIYAVASIFGLPFLFAYILEGFRRRAERRLNEAIQLAYAAPAAYRSQRLEALKQRFQKIGRLRHRQTPELMALLHAQHLFAEPCGWCEGRQLIMASEELSGLAPQSEADSWSVCARCGLKPEASTLSLE